LFGSAFEKILLAWNFTALMGKEFGLIFNRDKSLAWHLTVLDFSFAFDIFGEKRVFLDISQC